jgi:hypothetical protein
VSECNFISLLVYYVVIVTLHVCNNLYASPPCRVIKVVNYFVHKHRLPMWATLMYMVACIQAACPADEDETKKVGVESLIIESLGPQ